MSAESKFNHVRAREYTRDECDSFLTDIERHVLESHGSYLHSVLAINHLLESPSASEILDKELKERLRELWLKIKASGFQLNDPPILFGMPGKKAEH